MMYLFCNRKIHHSIRKVADILFVKDLSEQLDPGEAEAIALAKELKAGLLLIDEK